MGSQLSKPLGAPAHPHLHHQLQHVGCSHRRTFAVQTGLVWGEAHTEALWVGAAFPMDDLQLLPASSPPRWIILLCQVCNYRLCHLPSWAAGAGGRMFVLSPTSWVPGAQEGRLGCSGGSDGGCEVWDANISLQEE